MTREELVERMLDAQYRRDFPNWRNVETPEAQARMLQNMAAALDIAVGELLGDIDPRVYADDPDRVVINFELTSRRSHYLPKSDPAVDAVKEISLKNGWCSASQSVAEQIVAAVRKADAK